MTQPPSGQPYGQMYRPPPDHPQATTALVLGILGLVLCGVLAPFAWSIGGKAVREIEASRGTLGGHGSAQAGRIMGIIGTVLLALGLLVIVIAVIVGVVAGTTATTT